MSIGKNIAAIRKLAGLTQKELGARIGLSSQSIAQWENEQRNIKYENLCKVASALDVTVDDIRNFDAKYTYEDLRQRKSFADIDSESRAYFHDAYIKEIQAFLKSHPLFVQALNSLEVYIYFKDGNCYLDWQDYTVEIDEDCDLESVYMGIFDDLVRQIQKEFAIPIAEYYDSLKESENDEESPDEK